MKLNIMAINNLYNQLEFLQAWTTRTIHARYQQSFLGGLWAIIQPISIAAIFSFIFTVVIPMNTGGLPYIVFSYTAMVPWTLFASSVTDMSDSLVNNMSLVSKIYFPREMLPVAALLARLLDFSIASSILLFLLLYYRIPFNFSGLIFLPVILGIQVMLALGLGLIGAALNVYYRDVRHLFVLGLQIWLYATPIIYPVSLVPDRFRALYFFNPMAGIIEANRAVLLYQQRPGSYLIISAVISVIVLAVGYLFFKRVEPQFADII
jgi:lipopolysaccharide transport system permease protein